MFQLLKKLLILPFFYMCCVQQVGGNDVLHVNGTAGQNLTLTFTLKTRIKTDEQVNLYRGNTKIYKFNLSNRSCFSSINHTMPTICIKHVTQRNISLIFADVLHSAVYHLAVVMPEYNFEESNRVNLTVHPAKYTTYTAAPSFNITSFQLEQSERKFSMTAVALVLIVIMPLVIALLGLFYWICRRKTDKTPAVNTTSAPQVIPGPDVANVEYCVLDFPNRPGEKVRSTEEPVEYSPIVFPLRKTLVQDNEMKPTTRNKIKTASLQCEVKETDKVSKKENTSKPKHQRFPKKSHQITSCQISKTQV